MPDGAAVRTQVQKPVQNNDVSLCYVYERALLVLQGHCPFASGLIARESTHVREHSS